MMVTYCIYVYLFLCENCLASTYANTSSPGTELDASTHISANSVNISGHTDTSISTVTQTHVPTFSQILSNSSVQSPTSIFVSTGTGTGEKSTGWIVSYPTDSTESDATTEASSSPSILFSDTGSYVTSEKITFSRSIEQATETVKVSFITETVTKSISVEPAIETVTEYLSNAGCPTTELTVPGGNSFSSYDSVSSTHAARNSGNTVSRMFTPSASYHAKPSTVLNVSYTATPAPGSVSKNSTKSSTISGSTISEAKTKNTSSTASATSACPTHHINYSAHQFPYPYPGMDIQQWIYDYADWTVPMPYTSNDTADYGLMVPHLSIMQNLYFLQIECLPGQGGILPVDGLHFDQAKWMTEAPNRQPDDPVVVLLHGGSYFWGLMPNHVEAAYRIINGVNNPRFSLLLFDFTLSMEKKWPYQLQEMVALYKELMKTSSNIIIFTDSSGAHLGMELYIHMHQPFPGVDEIPANDAGKGLAMSSPWSDFSGANTLIWNNTLGVNIIDPVWYEPSAYAPAADPNLDWSKILPPKVLVTYGQNDTIIDTAQAFIRNANLSDDQWYMEPNAGHDTLVTYGDPVLLPIFVKFFNETFS